MYPDRECASPQLVGPFRASYSRGQYVQSTNQVFKPLHTVNSKIILLLSIVPIIIFQHVVHCSSGRLSGPLSQHVVHCSSGRLSGPLSILCCADITTWGWGVQRETRYTQLIKVDFAKLSPTRQIAEFRKLGINAHTDKQVLRILMGHASRASTTGEYSLPTASM